MILLLPSREISGCQPLKTTSQRRDKRCPDALLVILLVAWQIAGICPLRAQPTFSAKEALDWFAKHEGISYVGFGLPDKAAPWQLEKPEPEQFRQWLANKLGCDSVHYDRLWLVSGQKPHSLPAYSADSTDWCSWIARELLHLESGEHLWDKRPEVMQATLEQVKAERERLLESVRPRIPHLSPDEAAIVPLILRRAQFPALFENELRGAIWWGFSQFRWSRKEAPDEWLFDLQPGDPPMKVLRVRSPDEPPSVVIPLGELPPEKPSVWTEQNLQRPWGLFWEFWAPRGAKRWSVILPRAVSMTTSGSLQEVAAQLSAQLGIAITVSAPAEVRTTPIEVHLDGVPFWLVLHALSAVSGTRWQPWHDAASYELTMADDLPSRFFARFLSVEGRMFWLLQEGGRFSLTQLFFPKLTAEHQAQILRGEPLPLGQLSASEREAFERLAFVPWRVSCQRDAVRRLQEASEAETRRAIVVCFAERQPEVWLSAGGGWTRYTWDLRPVAKKGEAAQSQEVRPPVFSISTKERERKFAFFFDDYGDESGIPPRLVIGPRAKPEKLKVPRFVNGTVGAAKPKTLALAK